MEYSSCLSMSFGDNLELLQSLRLMMMLPMYINHLKTRKEKDAISEFKLRKKEYIHYKSIRLLKDFLKIDFKNLIDIPRRLSN
jgi:hypothetical protein